MELLSRQTYPLKWSRGYIRVPKRGKSSRARGVREGREVMHKFLIHYSVYVFIHGFT